MNPLTRNLANTSLTIGLEKREQLRSPYVRTLHYMGRGKKRLYFVYYETYFLYFIHDKKSLVCWNFYKFIRRLKHTCQRCMSDRLWQKGESVSGSQLIKNIFIVLCSARLNHLVVTDLRVIYTSCSSYKLRSNRTPWQPEWLTGSLAMKVVALRTQYTGESFDKRQFETNTSEL